MLGPQAVPFTSSGSSWSPVRAAHTSLSGTRSDAWHFSSVVVGARDIRRQVFCHASFGEHWGRLPPLPPPCCLHVLVHGAVSGELGLARRQFQVEVVDGERDDDYEGQDEAQNEGECLLQALPLVGDALVGWGNNEHSQHGQGGGGGGMTDRWSTLWSTLWLSVELYCSSHGHHFYMCHYCRKYQLVFICLIILLIILSD